MSNEFKDKIACLCGFGIFNNKVQFASKKHTNLFQTKIIKANLAFTLKTIYEIHPPPYNPLLFTKHH
jgi:hypothetical protein